MYVFFGRNLTLVSLQFLPLEFWNQILIMTSYFFQSVKTWKLKRKIWSVTNLMFLLSFWIFGGFNFTSFALILFNFPLNSILVQQCLWLYRVIVALFSVVLPDSNYYQFKYGEIIISKYIPVYHHQF